MIYTLTLNPAVDYTVTAPSFAEGVVQASSAELTPGGKGVNVSLALARMGVSSTVLGFFGGLNGRFILEELQKENIAAAPTPITGDTRMNVSLIAESDCHITAPGPTVSAAEQTALFNQLDRLNDKNLLCLCGSLPRGLTDDFYRVIFEKAVAQGAEVVMDITAKNAPELLKFHPWLIKPNREELQEVYGLAADTPEEQRASMKELVKRGAKAVLLSLGGEGSRYYDGTRGFDVSAAKATVVSATCAGDTALAGFIGARWENAEPIEYALKIAATAGAAATEQAGIGELAGLDERAVGVTVTPWED